MAKQESNKKNDVMEVKAFARYVHMSPRKLRLVADMIRKTNVEGAVEQLKFSSRNAAKPILKALNSAIANAIHNHELPRENLFVKSITVDGGPVYKRYAPRAQGRAFVERKRTSHINIVLTVKEGGKRKRSILASLKPKKTEIESKQPEGAEGGKVENEQVKPKQGPKSEQKVKQNRVDQKRRLFNRKNG